MVKMALLAQMPLALSGEVTLDSLGPEDSQPTLPSLSTFIRFCVCQIFFPPIRHHHQSTSPPQGDSNRHPPSHSTPHI
jgi:hypothetical protein